jgi:hypothetical protein
VHRFDALLKRECLYFDAFGLWQAVTKVSGRFAGLLLHCALLGTIVGMVEKVNR